MAAAVPQPTLRDFGWEQRPPASPTLDPHSAHATPAPAAPAVAPTPSTETSIVVLVVGRTNHKRVLTGDAQDCAAPPPRRLCCSPFDPPQPCAPGLGDAIPIAPGPCYSLSDHVQRPTLAKRMLEEGCPPAPPRKRAAIPVAAQQGCKRTCPTEAPDGTVPPPQRLRYSSPSPTGPSTLGRDCSRPAPPPSDYTQRRTSTKRTIVEVEPDPSPALGSPQGKRPKVDYPYPHSHPQLCQPPAALLQPCHQQAQDRRQGHDPYG